MERCGRCGMSDRVADQFHENAGYCVLCRDRMRLAEVVRELFGSRADIIKNARESLLMLKQCKCQSPHGRKASAAHLQQFEEITKACELIALTSLALEPSVTELEMGILRAYDRIRELSAAVSADAFRVRSTPYQHCVVYDSVSNDASVIHMGSGFKRWLGGGSGGRECGGPLRTEEEKRFGMCGTCLMRYGSGIAEPMWQEVTA